MTTQDNALTARPPLAMPTPASSIPPCGVCKWAVSVGLEKPLECHLNPPKPFVFLVGVKGKGVETISATKYADVGRDQPGCSCHASKLAVA